MGKVRATGEPHPLLSFKVSMLGCPTAQSVKFSNLINVKRFCCFLLVFALHGGVFFWGWGVGIGLGSLAAH